MAAQCRLHAHFDVRSRTGKAIMRRLLMAVTGVIALGTLQGCCHTAGVCDCYTEHRCCTYPNLYYYYPACASEERLISSYHEIPLPGQSQERVGHSMYNAPATSQPLVSMLPPVPTIQRVGYTVPPARPVATPASSPVRSPAPPRQRLWVPGQLRSWIRINYSRAEKERDSGFTGIPLAVK
jgi:hypothetical protein